LKESGLKRSKPADARTLIRRLSWDLTGFPPTYQQVKQFESDYQRNTQQAYTELVDQLISSPHYGERMAISWLDAVRFADTIGYHSDNPRDVWPYRDWVIASFNRNKPFDRFTLEQIAGDLLEDANQETRVGSAFNRLLLSTEEGGAQAKDYESRMLTDRVRAVGSAWLGQTIGCAQCHDHKFDPITMKDFYSLGAFFADLDEPVVGKREPGMPVANQEQQKRQQELESTQQLAQKRVTELSQVTSADTRDDEALILAKAELAESQKAYSAFVDSLPKCLVSKSSRSPRTVRILPRGNWMDESGEVVQAAVPHFLPQRQMGEGPLTRLDLAKWLVARDNPLTARNFVNRLWKQFFSTGLSRVLDDLGAQGEPPVNGPLLDWLACEFMDSGWNVKHLIRVMVTSQTYQQVPTATEFQISMDPDNRLCSRQSPFRIEAELVRDTVLATSGLLVRDIGGPSVKPYQPDAYWENLNFPQRDYVADRGPSQYRRGLYVWWQRSFLHPSLQAFDAPSREECTAERNRSNIPQQALVMLNDPTYVEAARALAETILRKAESDTTKGIEVAFQTALQRSPSEQELETLKKLLEQQLAHYKHNVDSANQFLKVGQRPIDKSIDVQQLAAWTHVARVLLNLHETITRN
jgi:Protein of unknown function (DUF1553)/Protein of unknown function (DUF1549)